MPVPESPDDDADGREPFSVLIDALERDGKPSLAWVTAHAPAGDLRTLWEGCNDPVALLYLLQRVAGVARAAEILTRLDEECSLPRPGLRSEIKADRDPALWLAAGFKHPGEEPALWIWKGFQPRRFAPAMCEVIRACVGQVPSLQQLIRKNATMGTG